VPVLFLYALGYGFDPREYLIVGRGGLYVYAPESNTNIYVDGEHKRTSGFFQREYFVQRLKPGTYQVLLQHDDFETWEKFVEVSGNRVTTLFPFLVPAEFPFIEIASSTEMYKSVMVLFATTTPEILSPAQIATTSEDIHNKPLVMTQNRLSLWFEDNQIFAEWQMRDSWIPDYFCSDGVCENPTVIAEVSIPIKRLEFYPGRNDVIIFSTEKGIYLAEVDKRPRQVFRSLYVGGDVDFRLRGDMLYIRDGVRIIEIEL
jgi:hypothetical protein